ncbi:NAD(P)-dependent alcohol dehydrogenase [Variovorax guangxiensis]|uniref:zinc-dependent alcohol dehydrogenase family protein n=1 Tax=Variovorax guangxiensis TaxID=1775474 RepID=UPI00285B9BC4|nr:NAD(P)-dependent alcohol dehydrogenase [Variovorax guangxiensis]MDR6858692.1 NADPH:quinone reductase-like Zn-dependent oxidoreductase [Variovorax guangxiensis]
MTSSNQQSRAFGIEKTIGIDGLIESVVPVPAPGPGEVLVHVHASSLNYRDVIILEGHYYMPIPSGRIPLSDGAGEIAAVGPCVTRFKVGDRVTNAFCPDWIDGPYATNYSQYSGDVDGWLADHRVVTAESLVHLPDGLTFEEAATLPCAGVTAWSALKDLQPGQTVVTLGAGGVSLFAIQLAKAMGARVIATTSSSAKAKQLKALGADDTIDYKSEPNWSQQVRQLTNGKGADRIVEVGGPGTFEQSVKSVAVGGQVSMVGAVAGMEGSIEFMTLFMSQARYQPISVGSRQDLEDMLRFIAMHNIHPRIDSEYEFDDAKLAFQRLMTRNVFGKVVIRH